MSVVLTAHFPLSGKTHDRLVDGSGTKAARAEFVAHSADPKTACLSAGGILKSESPKVDLWLCGLGMAACAGPSGLSEPAGIEAADGGARFDRMTMVRFVADLAWRRNRHSPDHLAVLRRLLVEFDDGEEIRGYVGLVLRPDVRPPPSSSPSTSWN
jgi:hypothetical protein